MTAPWRLLHGALVVGALGITLVLVTLGAATGIEPRTDLTGLLRMVAALELATVIVALTVIRRQIDPRRTDQELDAWWATYGGRVSVLWALAEGTAVIQG